jgi:putative transposase
MGYISKNRHKFYLKCHLIQVNTSRLWKEFQPILRKHFWKEHSFWSDDYFVCSIGEANPDTIRKYIENQG